MIKDAVNTNRDWSGGCGAEAKCSKNRQEMRSKNKAHQWEGGRIGAKWLHIMKMS